MYRWLAALCIGTVATPTLATTGIAPAAEPADSIQAVLQQDPRLETKVTLHLGKNPLSVIAAAVGGAAGVEIGASREVADEPAILYAADQPAKEVMQHLASLFNYRWTRTGKPGQYRYELFQDLKSRQEEEALRRQDHLRAVQGLQSALRPRLELAQRSPEVLHREAAAAEAAVARFEGLPEDQRLAAEQTPQFRALLQQAAASYQLREMADPLRRALVRVVPLLTPAQWNALMDGATVQFSTRPEAGSFALPPVLSTALRSTPPTSVPAGAQAPPASLEEQASFQQQDQKLGDHWSRAEEFRLSVRLAFSGEPGNVRAALTVTPRVLMPAGYQGEHPSLPSLIVAGDTPPDQLVKPHAPEGTDRSLAEDPILGAKGRLKIASPISAGAAEEGSTSVSFSEILAGIAEAYRLNLVADAYRSEPITASEVAGKELPLFVLLHELVLPRAGWSKEGAFLHVRERDWYHARLAEIPQRVVTQWAAHLRQARWFSLEDAATLALTLRDEQLAQFSPVMREEGIRVRRMFDGQSDDGGTQQREILRAYGSLLPGQQQALLAGRWVTTPAIPPEARRWLQAALGGRQQEQTSVSLLGPATEGALSLAIQSLAIGESKKAAPLAAPAPTGAGRVMQQAQFRYQYGENQAELFSLTLPLVEVRRRE